MFREREAEGTMRTDPITRRGWEDLARAAADVEDDAPAPTPVLSNEVPVLAGTPAAADWCRA
jgi:hypothetical protein